MDEYYQVLELRKEQESLLAEFLETYSPELLNKAVELQKKIEILLAFALR